MRTRETGRIQVQYLWVHECVRQGRFELTKVGGDANPSDLMTNHLTKLNFSHQEGRAKFVSSVWLTKVIVQSLRPEG